MKKTLLSIFMFVICFATAWAEGETFDFTNTTGLTPSITAASEISTGVIISDKTFTNGGISLSFVDPSGAQESNMGKIWTTTKGTTELRVYKNSTFTIAADKAITSITFTGGKITTFSPNSGTLSNGVWTGSAETVVFSVTGTLNITTINVELSDGGEDEGGEGGEDEGNETPATTATLWSETFASSQGDFTFNDVQLPEGSTYVWKYDSYGYMKASAYVNKTNLPSESWLLSPEFDLTKATKLTLSFEQAGNYFQNTENLLAACKVMVKEVGAEEWTALNLDVVPEGTSWTFVTSTADLSAYDGKKAQIAFVYTSTADVAGTWEVKNFELKGEGEVSIVPDEEPVVVLDGITALKAEAVGKHTVKLTDAIVTYINGSNFYMQDANAGINGYMNDHGLVAGQKINGEVVVTTSLYGGAVQIGSIELGSATVTDDAEIPCTEVSVAELVANGAKYENMRVKVVNATLTTAFVAAAEGVTQNRNGEIEQSGSTVAIYQKDKNAVFEIAAGSMVDVVGYPGFYNGALQLNVWETGDITAVTPEGISNITLNGNAVIYSIDGRRLAQPVKGINIINGKKVYVK